ncbi:MAG: hypothetical protein ACJ8C4_02165 [Gemmataceae bacterium]
MIAAFCLRLALGVLAPLMILPLPILHSRFVRTQFLVALGLVAVAGVSGSMTDSPLHLAVLIATGLLALAGSVVWSLEPPPWGNAILHVNLVLLLTLVCRPIVTPADGQAMPHAILGAVDGVTSALLLGGALTAMLVGHSYLISPGLSMLPLNRIFALLTTSLGLRAALSGFAWWLWSDGGADHTVNADATYWLPVRWLVGLGAPAGFTLMAWLTARIRSTQSATGILYVVVICVFLGELIGLLLLRSTGLPL